MPPAPTPPPRPPAREVLAGAAVAALVCLAVLGAAVLVTSTPASMAADGAGTLVLGVYIIPAVLVIGLPLALVAEWAARRSGLAASWTFALAGMLAGMLVGALVDLDLAVWLLASGVAVIARACAPVLGRTWWGVALAWALAVGVTAVSLAVV